MATLFGDGGAVMDQGTDQWIGWFGKAKPCLLWVRRSRWAVRKTALGE
jgi:hypothetical protein